MHSIARQQCRCDYSARTERDLFPGVWRQTEGEKSHAGDYGAGDDEDAGDDGAGDDEVEDVIERPTTDVDRERDVDVLLRTTVVLHHISLRRQTSTNAQTTSTGIITSADEVGEV